MTGKIGRALGRLALIVFAPALLVVGGALLLLVQLFIALPYYLWTGKDFNE